VNSTPVLPPPSNRKHRPGWRGPWWTPRRVFERARLVLAVALHAFGEAVAGGCSAVACRIVPDWEGGE